MSRLTTAFLLIGVFSGWASSATVQQFVLGSESILTLEGNSTLHPYASTATQVHVQGEFAPQAPVTLAQGVTAGQVKKFEVTILVEGLKSGESGLDKRMYKALKAKEFPDIGFSLSNYEISSSSDSIKATGVLTIAGEQKAVELNAEIRFTDDRMKVHGSQTILMTDYGVKPPTFMGMLKTNNRVVVHYDLTLTRKEGVP